MKRIISIFLVAITLFVLAVPAFAIVPDDTHTEYFNDGSYIVISESDEKNEASDDNIFAKIILLMKRLISILTGEKELSKTKYLRYYDKNGELLWTVYLTGTFTYNGKSSKCTKATTSADIYDSDWKLISSKTSKTGSTATVDFAMRQYKLGVALKLIEKSITITCDNNGKIS